MDVIDYLLVIRVDYNLFYFQSSRSNFFVRFQKYYFIFITVRTAFFSLYKMTEKENSSDNYKTLKISIRTIIKIQKS